MRGILFFIGLLSAAFAASAMAQTPVTTQLRLETGTVFEVLAPDLPAIQTPSWSLSQEKSFLQASRNRIFRTRFISPGTYTLNLEYGRLPNVESHTLRIVVESTPVSTKTDSAAGRSISATVPARDAYGRVVLPGGTGIVGLYPYQTLSGSMMSLDIDDTQDADGDGDMQNDNVVAGTYFSVRGTPLFLWYLTPNGKRVVTVESGGGNRTVVPVLDAATALEQEKSGELTAVQAETLPPLETAPPVLLPPTEENEELPILQGNGDVMAQTLTGTLLRFSLTDKEPNSQNLLLRWTFGDGTESLLDAPVHRYARAGTYTVQVTATDLRTARIVGTETIIVQVEEPTNGPISAPGENASSSSAPNKEPAGNGGTNAGWFSGILSFFAIIWKYFFWFLLSALVAIAVRLFFGLTRRMGSIPDLVAKVEKSFTEPGSTKGADIADIIASPAAPLALNVVETTAEEVAPEEAAETPPERETAATPDWLKDGLEMAAATGQTPDSPPPPALNITVQPSPPLENIAAAPTPEPVYTPEPEPLPEVVLPEPVPEQTPQPVLEPAVAETPPIQNSAPAPDWLTAPLPTMNNAQPAEVTTNVAAPAIETVEQENPTAPVPDWLTAPLPTLDDAPPAEANTEDRPQPPAPETTVTVVPEQTQATPEAAQPTEATQLAEEDDETETAPAETKAWADMTPEEREREKKRQKRKRYRQNKKLREKNTAAAPATAATTAETTPEKTKESEPEKHDDEDGPTFVIRADSIS